VKHTCYLCMVHVMGADRVPRFRGFEIYSTPPWNVTASGRRFLTIYYQTEADTYDKARNRLIEVVRDFPTFAWIWPWVDPSMEAHKKRFDMERALEALEGA